MLLELIKAAFLGVIEGLTEFIPVSSTGHLIIAGDLIRFSGAAASTFEIVIQLGAILAVVALYWDRFRSMMTLEPGPGATAGNGWRLLFLTTLPALVIGALAHHAIKKYLFNIETVSLALLVGGIAILVVENKLRGHEGRSGLESLTARDALLIGFFQCLAMWPGMSRSTCTILGAMLLGLDRRTSAEYSFLAAVPVMFAASAFDLYKNRQLLTASDIPAFVVGFVVAFVSALFALRYFLRLVSTRDLKPFGWYRIAIAPAIYLYFYFQFHPYLPH